jgi:hypothetical protein
LIPFRNFLEKEKNLLKSMLDYGSNYRPTIHELLTILGYESNITEIKEPGTGIPEIV